ncbi:helix-turn-helix transcriptional regulator [Pseudonocardia sp. CA-107938]|uniref:helix-turn-helix transcriptional regulator n=1 Tax=Pseudonocardia sp. CA-107938 TaxID=3240021 RepID=UPI003D8AE962
MNRTDRLYALVEELRAVAPRPRSARWLADRFEVSIRTVERDLDALRQSGVPIWAEPGRTGGYALDRDRTLPPLALTAAEALAISVALRTAAGSPFDRAARSAAQKVLATLPADVRRTEGRLTGQVFRLDAQAPHGPTSPAADQITDAVVAGRVLDVTYVDRAGQESRRTVEPLGVLWGTEGWYVLGWCRLRTAVRAFRLDRIVAACATAEPVPQREVDLAPELRRIGARPLHD